MAPFAVLNYIVWTAVQQTIKRTMVWEMGSRGMPGLTPSPGDVEVIPPSVIPLKL